jgi:hypothetical protein
MIFVKTCPFYEEHGFEATGTGGNVQLSKAHKENARFRFTVMLQNGNNIAADETFSKNSKRHFPHDINPEVLRSVS